MQVNMFLFLQAVTIWMIREAYGSEQIFTNVGETVLLKYQTMTDYFHSTVWRKGDITIFQGLSLNPLFENSFKYSLTGDHKKGEIFLKIYNITEDDLKSYWCETQTLNGADHKMYTVLLRQTTQYSSAHTNSRSRKTTSFTASKYSNRRSRETTTFIVDSSTSDIGSTASITFANDRASTSQFGPKLNWIISGLVSPCIVISLAASVFCIIKVYRKPLRFQEHRQSLNESSPYDYIDDRTLMCYVEPVQSVVPSLPVRSGVSVNSFISSSSRESVEETLNDSIHPYQSLLEIDNKKLRHHYIKIKNFQANDVTIYSFIYIRHRRSDPIRIERSHIEKIDHLQNNRANSLPRNLNDRKIDLMQEQSNTYIDINKPNWFGIRAIRDSKNNNATTNLDKSAPLDISVIDHIQANKSANVDEKNENTVRISNPLYFDAKTRRSTSQNNAVEGFEESTRDTLSSSINLTNFESSSKNDSIDGIRCGIAVNEIGPYEDLSRNDSDNVHDCNVISAPFI